MHQRNVPLDLRPKSRPRYRQSNPRGHVIRYVPLRAVDDVLLIWKVHLRRLGAFEFLLIDAHQELVDLRSLDLRVLEFQIAMAQEDHVLKIHLVWSLGSQCQPLNQCN